MSGHLLKEFVCPEFNSTADAQAVPSPGYCACLSLLRPLPPALS
jgi:hypothetical protein